MDAMLPPPRAKRKAPDAPPERFPRTASNMPRHNHQCETCGLGGDLLCCDTCNFVFHLPCLPVPLLAVPEGMWRCHVCVAEKAGQPRPRLPAPPARGVEDAGGSGSSGRGSGSRADSAAADAGWTVDGVVRYGMNTAHVLSCLGCCLISSPCQSARTSVQVPAVTALCAPILW